MTGDLKEGRRRESERIGATDGLSASASRPGHRSHRQASCQWYPYIRAVPAGAAT